MIKEVDRDDLSVSGAPGGNRTHTNLVPKTSALSVRLRVHS